MESFLFTQYVDFDYILTGDVGGGADDNACTGRSASQVNIETPMVQTIVPVTFFLFYNTLPILL